MILCDHLLGDVHLTLLDRICLFIKACPLLIMHHLHLHGVLDQVLHIAPRYLLAQEDVLLLVL